MSGEFFSSVNSAAANTPIQFFQDSAGREYSTTNKMARYVNEFLSTLFTSQGESPDCHINRERVWNQVPKVVTTDMNAALTSPITLIELREAMHSLPTGKAPWTDGFHVDFFLVLWETLDSDLLEACQEALRLGILHKELNTSTLCLIPKRSDKTNFTYNFHGLGIQVYCKTACTQNPTLVFSTHMIQSNRLHKKE